MRASGQRLLSLSHFAARAVGALEVRRNQLIDTKPAGLWVSVDGEDDWESWCKTENYELPALAVRHRVTVHHDANVLLISSVEEIDDFHERYSAPLFPGKAYCDDYIDWREVCRQHDGIIIAPYLWQRRLQGRAHRWYYGWDCASGCIWNPRAIGSIEVVVDSMRVMASRMGT